MLHFKAVFKIQLIQRPCLHCVCFRTISPKCLTLVIFLYSTLHHLLYSFLFVVLFLEHKLLEARDFCIFISPLYPQHLQQFIGHRRLTGILLNE